MNSILLNVEMTKHLIKASPRYILINIINVVLNVISSLFQILFFQSIIDNVIYNFKGASLEEICLKFLIYYLINMLTYSINHLVTQKFNQYEKVKICYYYKSMIYNESVKKKLENYNSEEYANMLHNAIYNDGDYLYAFSENIFNLIYALLSLIGIIPIFFNLHPVFIILSLLLSIKNSIFNRKKNAVNYEIYKNNLRYERKNKYIYNIFFLKQYIRELKIFFFDKLFIDKYNSLQKEFWLKNEKQYRKQNVLTVINELIDVSIYIFNLIFLTSLLVSKAITVGQFNLILGNFTTVVQHFGKIGLFFSSIYNDSKYISDIQAVIKSEDYKFPKVNSHGKNEIRFNNVCFSYDNKKNVLEGINVIVPLNMKIAIVGQNGSGKSTFIKLLLGLYTPTSGEIEYCFNDSSVKCSVDLFGTLLQDFKVFDLTVAQNILPKNILTKSDIDRIMKAVKFSELEVKIHNLEKGMDTVLSSEFSEEGTSFSGGEQQKLAIARAYVKEAPILILDEPSSSLDPLASAKIIEKINSMSKDKASLLITHNISQTKNADLVFYFSEGTIAEYGSPYELIRKKGLYYDMFVKQNKNGDDVND